MKIDVSIIIVNYKTVDLIINCINSIIEKTHGISYEIIVVDNASLDNCKSKIWMQFGEIVSVLEAKENLGFGKANNLGINIAKGRNIFFINPDTLLINNAIKILSDYLDNKGKVAACGGNLFDINGLAIHSYNIVYPSIFDEIDQACHRLISKTIYGKSTMFNHSENPKKVAYITGADLMIKRYILNKVGVFNPEFFMYYEETDLQKRIHDYGYKIYNVPSARIIHLEGGSFKMSRNREFMSLMSRKIYYRLHHKPYYCWISDKLYKYMIKIGLLISYISCDRNLNEKLSQRLEILEDLPRSRNF